MNFKKIILTHSSNLALLVLSVYFISCQDEAKIAPSVTTGTVSNITKNSATVSANATSDGRAAITARGIVWSTSENPTITDNKTSNGTGTGAFSGDIAGLDANTVYYARAYATNSQGTSYGSQVTFTTDDLPQVSTGVVSDLTKAAATVAGSVTFDGNTTVTDRGIVWSTNHNPTLADSKVSNGTGTGDFTGGLTGLTANTTYYARAFATNSQGTAYGTEVQLLTLADPSVTSGGTSKLDAVSVTVDGNVTFDGNTSITSRGICWSVNHNPIITSNVVDGGSGTGTFNGSITGLSPSSTYYARAFATNSQGTSYGSEVTITTPDINAGMVANYKFDNSYADNTGNNNALNPGANVSFGPDRNSNANGAVVFNGTATSNMTTSGGVAFGNSSSISISMWFYAQNTGIYLMASNRFQYYYTTGGGVYSTSFVINGPTTTGFASQNYTNGFLNNWHHFVGTYDGTTMTYYLDGALVKTTSFTLGLNFTGIDFSFGNYFGSPNYFSGSLDDVKMYNRTVTANEVSYIYNH